MKRTFRNLSSLLLALVMLLSLSVTAFAADSSITFKGAQEGFDFQPGSEYTATDLFDNFKDVMPGDQLTETITIKNEAADCDYIKVYMRAVPHDEEGNPLTYDEAFENADGKDQAKVEGERDETTATMADFLSQLTMRVYNGAQLIFQSSPNQAGALADNVLLGTLRGGEALALTVELDVPVELDNAYANRVGEVNWVFLVEAFDYDKLTVHKVWDDNNYPNRPDSTTVQLLCDGQVQDEVVLSEANQWTYTWDQLDELCTWTVVEEDVPEGYQVSYSTADNTTWITNHMDYVPEEKSGPIDLTVQKIWSGDEEHLSTRPGAVSVTLYNGSVAVQIVTLSAENNWTHTWNGLDGEGDWSVIETGIPKGYIPYYQKNGGTVIITNTATLIQTGQLNWPIPVLGCLGAALILSGAILLKKKRRNEHA